MSDLGAELLRSPAGVAWLAELELSQRDGRLEVRFGGEPMASEPAAVAAAVDAVGGMTFGEVVRGLVAGAEHFWGPWNPGAESLIVAAYASVAARAEIAEAVVARFGPALESAVALDRQEWWLTATDLHQHASTAEVGSVFAVDRGVYCCGEFTWNSVRTVSAPPEAVHDDLIDVWELYSFPVSRWRVPVRSDARVYEVHRPADWARLVASYPTRPGPTHGGRELPGSNFHPSTAARLEVASDGAAARRDVEVVMPDWERVAADFDGVHLSWSGMATCEGRVIDVDELGAGVVSMVRYWGSERTLWLNDVFETPTPLPAPSLSGRIDADVVDADDPLRRVHDARVINRALGRIAVGGDRSR